MVKVKNNLCSLLIAALLLGIVTVPITAAENKSDISTTIIHVEKSGTQEVIYGEATKEKGTMYGKLYITVYWQKTSGVTTITGVKRAWDTDPYMELVDAWSLSTYGQANFWDDTHHVGDSVIIYASEI